MIVSQFTIDARGLEGRDGERIAAAMAEAGRVGKVLVCFPEGLPNDRALLDWLRRLGRYVVVAVRGRITTPDPVESLLRAGIASVVVEDSMPVEAISRLPRDRTMVALDPVSYSDHLEVENTGAAALVERMNSLAPWVSGFMVEPAWSSEQANRLSIGTIRRVRGAAGGCLWAKHQQLTVDDVPIFDALRIDAVVENPDVRLCADAFVQSLEFREGVVPTVAVDKYGQVLRVAWSSPRTLSDSIISGSASYCARDGGLDEVATGVGRLLRVLPDDGRTALMFVVAPFDLSGTRFSYSTFGTGGREFGLHRLFEIIQGLKERPRPGSYTSFLFEKEDRIPRKLNEEVRELLEAGTRDEIAWEAADVLFFLFAYLAGTDVPLDDVVAELMGRRQ